MLLTRCKTCVMPTTRPDTEFVDGECSACINFRKRADIDWAARANTLAHIVKECKRVGARHDYDCIVPSSGGKDSTYQVLTLLGMGLRPLVVTASTCMLTPIGRANINNLARLATTIEVTPNRTVRAKLNKFGLETVGDISYPEHLAIFTTPFQEADAYNIPFLFYGESPQQEYGCPQGANEATEMTQRWIHEFGGLLGMRAQDCIGYEGITAREMGDYEMPAGTNVAAFFLGQFIPWDSHRNAALAREAGMMQSLPSMASYWPAENLDNAMTGLHDHSMYRKYGFGRLCSQLSVDIRNGRIARDDAMDLVAKRDGLFPFIYANVTVEEVCAHLGITMEWLGAQLDRFTNWDLFEGVEHHRPILREFDSARSAA